MDQAEKLRNVIKVKNQKPVSRARVITVTSGKGGVGKSNVTVNMAVQLSKLGKSVIIFDADLGLANVEVMFGAIPKYNVSDLIYQGKGIKDIITPGPLDIGFISGGSGILGMNNLSKDQIDYLVHCLGELDGMADIILVDTGAGIADSVLEFVLASPEVLLVSTLDPSSLTDAYSLLKVLYRNPNFLKNGTKVDIIANRVHSEAEGRMVYDKLNVVVSQFLKGEINYLGMVPQDALLERAVRQQKPVSLSSPNAKSAKAFEVLASNLLNHTNDQFAMRRGFGQLLASFINR